MSEHAEGPWTARGFYVYGPYSERIAETHPIGYSSEAEDRKAAANTRLIAAAPDLLEAAKATYEAIGKGWLPNPADVAIVLGRLGMAVEKAEGKA